MKRNLNDLEKDVLERMIANLPTLEDREVYVEEIGFTLFEAENIDGSMTCSRAAARDWIVTYFDDIGEVVQYIQELTGEVITPFDNPEAFMVQVCMWVADALTQDLEEEFSEPKILFDEDLISSLTAAWETVIEQ